MGEGERKSHLSMQESKLSNLGVQFLLSLNGRHIGYLKDDSSCYLELI